MPQYHPPRSLAGQPFSWVIADFQPDLAALQAFVRAFPSEPGIRQVIAPVAIPTLEPGLEATEVPAEAGQGMGGWLSRALVEARFERVLVLGGPVERYPSGATLSLMADKLDLAHLVLAPRPQNRPGALARGMHGLWNGMARWILALEAKPEPRWPGWSAWTRRLASRWVLAVPGNDPGTPHRMLRREMIPSLNLQSASGFAWVEMVAKATFLGALVEELPTPTRGEGDPPVIPAEPDWWRDFRKLCSDPVFGRPWNPHQADSPGTESQGPPIVDPAQTAV